MTTEDFVDLSASRVLCNFHPLPWKDTWKAPETVLQVMKFIMALFDALVNDESFAERCGKDTAKINDEMPIPLCCWVAVYYPEKLQAAYDELGVTPPDANERAILN